MSNDAFNFGSHDDDVIATQPDGSAVTHSLAADWVGPRYRRKLGAPTAARIPSVVDTYVRECVLGDFREKVGDDERFERVVADLVQTMLRNHYPEFFADAFDVEVDARIYGHGA